jgi:pyruvate/2-oxoacid:ferredoxin oxidoreductase beta subunit/Pyruvate/2-oxoacid:ferredoxin oxidoreductase gamma subunit
MSGFLNKERPLVFCPGCAHEVVVRGLDRALQQLGVSGDQVVIVSDIGCSGLFDTFFNTHAFHGLHGRALTYATGIKMAKPELRVIVVMGDGGLGIGGAHVLSSCRRNLDLTLLVLNNFNYGMTGGQCSATTPMDGQTASGFLAALEAPLDICGVAVAAGAPYVDRLTATGKDLADRLVRALSYPGFSLVDIWGLCPGRYTKRNRLTLTQLEEDIGRIGIVSGPVASNEREEYSAHYRRAAALLAPPDEPAAVTVCCRAPVGERSDILLLGSAGQYINTAGEVLCLSGMSGGLRVTQKNDYPITVLRGHSIAEVVFCALPIEYTGMGTPAAVLCLAAEGVVRRRRTIAGLPASSLLIKAKDVVIGETAAKVIEVDFTALGVKGADRATAALAVLAEQGVLLTREMLAAGMRSRYRGRMLESSEAVVARMYAR